MTINKAARVDKYLIPRIEELFTSLAGGKAFNTQTGLFEYKTLPFSVASAPSIFSMGHGKSLTGIPGVSLYQQCYKAPQAGPPGKSDLNAAQT